MANPDRPNGFKPVGTISGGNWEGKVRQYIADSASADISIGDAVLLEADGHVTRKGVGGVCLGVCVGVTMVDSVSSFGEGNAAHQSGLNLEENWHDASDGNDHYVLVAVGPDVLYEAQSDDASLGGIASIGLVGDNTDPGTGTYSSDQELDGSDFDLLVGSWVIHDVVRKPDNELGAANDRYIVAINEYQLVDSFTGV